MKLATRFVLDDRGMETVEWAVLAAMIVAGLITAVTGLGTNVKSTFLRIQTGTKQ